MMATVLPFPAPPPAMTPDRPDPAPDADWGLWMARAQAGDREAYRRLLTAVAPYLRAIARRHFGSGDDADDADDAVQEILMVVHDIRHTYEPGRPFKPWLSTIATRRCIDLLRRRVARTGHEAAAGDVLPDVADAAPGPEDLAVRESAAARLHRAVDALPEHQRRAVRLVHLAGRTPGEAAAETGHSAGALKVACHRALRSLRNALTRTEER